VASDSMEDKNSMGSVDIKSGSVEINHINNEIEVNPS
jgi:hypothetical protein